MRRTIPTMSGDTLIASPHPPTGGTSGRTRAAPPPAPSGLGPTGLRPPKAALVGPASPHRRALLSLGVLAVLVAGLASGVVVGAGAVAAHGRDANGCTGVPDAGYGFDFHTICDRHDRCYRQPAQGRTADGRRRCDRAFLTDMQRSCNRHRRYSAPRLVCRSTARIYYIGVRALGRRAWQQRLGPLIG